MPSEYKAILALVAVALFAVLLRAVNLKRAVRGRQFLSAVLSPVVACGGVVGALVWFRGYEPDEESLLWGAEPFVWNLFILAAFLVLKLVLLPVMSRMWSKEARMEATSGAWYEFDPDLRRWFLKSRMRDMRMLIDAFAWVITAFSAVVLAVGLAAGPESELLLRVFPCAAMLVFTEASNFLGGMTKEEFCHDIGGEDSSANRIEAYYKLRKVYEDLFPQALLSAHTGNEFAGRPGAVETVDRMLASEDAKERLAYEQTKLIHGEEEAERARAAAKSLFSGDGGSREGIPTVEVSAQELKDGLGLLAAMVRAGFCKSNSEARTIVVQGGAEVNGEKVGDPRRQLTEDDLDDKGEIMLKAGKKKHCRLCVK